MAEIDDGGPAFPQALASIQAPAGMSLRDYFAAHAMQGLLASCGNNLEFVVKASYKYADAMLVAR